MAMSSIIEFCLRMPTVRPNFYNIYRYKTIIDYSKFPELKEEELDEQFIKGHGPGGSNVNKTTNCVLLKHLPTGTIVKCHKSRLLQKNRKLARELLLNKLDEFYNGNMSVNAQEKRIENLKLASQQKKQEKLRELKRNFLLNSEKNT